MNESAPYCGTGLIEFSKFHEKYIHGYISLVICVAGFLANIIIVIVFTRKHMTTPTNVILTGLAIADSVVLLDYIPFAYYLYLKPKHFSYKEKHSYTTTFLLLWQTSFSQVFHTISIWLTVVLAIWRYIAVVFPHRSRDWCKMESTIRAVTAVYVMCPVICLPLLLSYVIRSETLQLDEEGWVSKNESIGTNTTIYFLRMTSDEFDKRNVLQVLNFVIYALLIKLLPAITLTVLSFRLMYALVQAKKRRRKLTTHNLKHNNQTDRTTKMLLTVLITFLIIEVPQGILGLVVVIVNKKFYFDCYEKLGDLIDLLALLNSAINFAVYYIMSSQFRTTFKSLLGNGKAILTKK